MILYKEAPVLLNQLNIIMLDCNEDSESVVYVSHHTYTQAAILEDMFAGDISLIADKIDVDLKESPYAEAIDTFYNGVDAPLNMLAPFLGLIHAVNFNQESFEACCGMLHIISNTINFKSFVTVGKEIRADVRFVGAVLNSYRRSWEELETKLVLPSRNMDVETNLAQILSAHLDLIAEMRAGGVAGGLISKAISEEAAFEARVDRDKVDFEEPEIDWDKLWEEADAEAEAEIAKKKEESDSSKPATADKPEEKKSRDIAPPPLPLPATNSTRANAEGGAETIARALGSSAVDLENVPQGGVRASEVAEIEDIMNQFGGSKQ